MKWGAIKSYMQRADNTEDMEQTGYLSYIPSENILIQIRSQTDNVMHTAEYFQIIQGDENTPYVLVVQLEGLPEDPNTYEMTTVNVMDVEHITFPDDEDIYVEIYKRWN